MLDRRWWQATLVFLVLSVAGLLLDSRAAAEPVDLIQNGGFEDGSPPSGWTAQTSSLTSASSPTRSGSSSLKLTNTDAGVARARQAIGIRPGSTYTFSAFAYQDDARIRSVYLQIRWRPNPDGTGADLSVTESTFRLTDRQGAFRPLTTGPVSAPGQALSAVVTLVIVPFGVDPGAVYFDDATFVGDAPLPTSTPTQTPTTTSTATPTATADITTGRPGDVIISELIYDPATSPDQDGEWVELYNTTDSAIRLAGWRLADNTAEDLIPTLSIPPHDFVVIAATNAVLSDYPELAGKIVTLPDGTIGNGLANSGDRLIVFDGHGLQIDAISFGDDRSVLDPAPKAKEGQSLDRSSLAGRPAAPGDFNPNSSPAPGRPPVPTPTPTPTRTPVQRATSTATPTVEVTSGQPGSVLLSEVLFDPTTTPDRAGEWVEIYNTAPGVARLAGWTIGDGEEDDVIPTLEIQPGGFAIIAASVDTLTGLDLAAVPIVVLADGSIGNGLANSGDSLILRDGQGQVVDALSYDEDTSVLDPAAPGVRAGWSLERTVFEPRLAVAEDFRANPFPSPGLPPQPLPETSATPTRTPRTLRGTRTPTPTPDPAIFLERFRNDLITIAEARQRPAGAKVHLLAQVTIPTRAVEVRRIWIQDETGGIAAQVRFGGFPEFKFGDWVLIVGEMSERLGERDVRVYRAYDSIRVRSDVEPEPLAVKAIDAREHNEGWLVEIEGRFRALSDGNFIDDDSGRARLRLTDGLLESVEALDRKPVRAVGVVSQWDSRPPYDAGYRVLLRRDDDLTLLPEGTLTPTATPTAAARPNRTATPTNRPTVLPKAGMPSVRLVVGLGVVLLLAGVYLSGTGLAARTMKHGKPPRRRGIK